jgi:hypothetical protein
MAHYGSYGDEADGEESGLESLLGYEGIQEIMGDEADGDDSGDDSGNYQYVQGSDMGAAKRRHKGQGLQQQAIMKKRIASGALLRSLAPRSAREFIIGLGITAIPGNGSAQIGVQPQVIFRPERIVIPSNIAVDFMITDVKVGKDSQLVSPGAIPAVVFVENAFGVRLKMDTAQIAQFITLLVNNTNAQPRNFSGAIIGPAVQ